MAHRGDVLIHVVTKGKRKMRSRLGHKARGQDQVLLTHLAQMTHHRRRSTAYPTPVRARNVGNP
jgi:hypothetical protein